jgi:lactate dehydrogenase-like 2-hydroxyacid dehydrogenase
MNKFKKIRLVHVTSLSVQNLEIIQTLSEQKIEILEDLPSNPHELLKFIGNADALLVSTRVIVNASVIQESPKLKYIGIYGTYRGGVDENEAHIKQIKVTNIEKYCEEETAQFCIDELEKWFRGHPEQPRKKIFGIIGMGKIGKQLAKFAVSTGYSVIYSSRNRVPEMESAKIEYVDLNTLLIKSDIISLQVPVGCKVLAAREFELMPTGKILINTARDQVMDPDAFHRWLLNESNIAIMDSVGAQYFPSVQGLNNVVSAGKPAWLQESSKKRLGEIFIENMVSYLKDCS